MKVIHFIPNCSSPCIIHSFAETMEKIKEADREDTDCLISTSQIAVLEFAGRMLDEGWAVYVTDDTGTYQIKLGWENKCTNRRITPESNLLRLWHAGEFSAKQKDGEE